MDCLSSTDQDEEFLNKCNIQDASIWLLSKLRVFEHESNPYTLPFCSYVLSWYRAIPLRCIIMGQSPYPDNVYPPIAAAMSFSTELGLLQMAKNKRIKRPGYNNGIPPTVEVFANDMFINAGMKKEDTVNILKNGWALIEFGILLVNEGVYMKSNDPEYYDESSDQNRMIIKMLRETEKHGKRTVDVYGLGEAGQRMASNLCSWYKSSTVKLSKHTTTHPAALSRRFDDLNHPDCHMNTPTFSKSLVKYFSNHVAFSHTMAKKSDADIKVQRYADIIRGCGVYIKEQQACQDQFNDIVGRIIKMENWDETSIKDMFTQLHKAGTDLSFRMQLSSATMSNIQRIGDSISGNVSKPGPSIQNPSSYSLSEHTGKEFTTSNIVAMQPKKFSLTKTKSTRGPESIAETSSFDHVSTNMSPPPSIISAPSSVTPRKFNLSKSRSTNTTPIKKLEDSDISKSTPLSVSVSAPSTTTGEEISDTLSQNTEREEPRIISSLGSRFKKMDLTRGSRPSGSFGQKETPKKEEDIDSQYKLTPKQRDHLSSIQVVVETHVPDAEDSEVLRVLEGIQDDIQQMRIYNTRRFVDAIIEDMKKDPKFDFSIWAIDDSRPSATFNVCKEVFEF